tara:strand:+ start:585 stop:917 length:333 start_codon:yes stop_codon:yes gene_type:complete
MFIYSGISKIKNFHKKVLILQSKTHLPHIINILGMFGVMVLEVFGSLIMISHFYNPKLLPIELTKMVSILFILFLIVVTMLYHPPWDKKIPFLSNLTTLAGLFMINEKLK